MSIKELQNYTFISRYSRYDENKKRRETWNESNDRVKNMHLKKYPQIADEIEWAFEQVRNKRVLGSQRALQFGGKPIEKNHARLYNCVFSYCDRVRFFQEAFWLLLCGSGVGFSVQKHHIDKLPFFIKRKGERKFYTIEDSIEGWANALGVLIGSYLNSDEFSEYQGCDVVFDYSEIRPAGSKLSSCTGKAPGPMPLRIALEKIRIILNDCLEIGQLKLKPINAYDIIMHASDAVLSGGVRRSATICLFSHDDIEMATAKTGNWFKDNPQRGRSNNSAVLLRNNTTKEEFLKLIECVKEFGEPGFLWTDSLELGVNPCVEVGFYPVDIETMKSGWQFCNLCEINGKKIKTIEDFRIAAKAAAIIGTCQAAYDEFPYLGEISEKIIRREALLGVSITGMMDSAEILFDPNIQDEMAKLILQTNEEIANKIGINPCARATCVKPAGTSSCILGSSSGIHPHHAKRYFRHIQSNALEAPLQYFKGINPNAVEKSVWSANGTDDVIVFCVEVPDGSKTKNQVDAITLLDHVKLTQQHWVSSGKRPERCTQNWLTNNVSNTINVKEEEWDDVANYIYDNRKHFAGISLLPMRGDLDYPQAPFVAVHAPKELVSIYGDGVLMASGLIVDGLRIFKNDLWKACSYVLNPDSESDQEKLENSEQKLDWSRRVKQFAVRYLENDVRKCCYLMKEVSNWKKWCDLNREYKDVDYSNLIEEEDNTTLLQEVACAGGKCEV